MQVKKGVITLSFKDFLKVIFFPIYLLILPILHWNKKIQDCNIGSSLREEIALKRGCYILFTIILLITFFIQFFTFNRRAIFVRCGAEDSLVTHVIILEESCKLGLRPTTQRTYSRTTNGMWHLLDSNNEVVESYHYRDPREMFSKVWEFDHCNRLNDYTSQYLRQHKFNIDKKIISNQTKELLTK